MVEVMYQEFTGRERARFLYREGHRIAEIARMLSVGDSTVRDWVRDLGLVGRAPAAGMRYEGMKQETLTYEDLIGLARMNQQVRGKLGWSQERIGIDLRHVTEPVLVLGLSDLHIGSWGADHDTLDRFTQFICRMNGRVLVALVGDLINLAIKLRGVLEVKDDMFQPEMQHAFVALWLEKIAPFVLCAGWGNHDVEREEMGAGASLHKYIMSRRVPWFNGIGTASIHLGSETYELAISHRFKGSGSVNVTRGQRQFMKEQHQGVELAIAGDLHNPALDVTHFGERQRVAINLGSLQLNSGFAKRYFSARTEPIFPCVELYPDTHMMNPYWSVNHWLKATGQPLEYLEPRQYLGYSLKASA